MYTFTNGLYLSELEKQPTKPEVAKLINSKGETLFIVIGTLYGYLHTNQGCIRVWRSYSGARRACVAYAAMMSDYFEG